MRLHRAEEEAESLKDIAALDRLLNEDFISCRRQWEHFG